MLKRLAIYNEKEVLEKIKELKGLTRNCKLATEVNNEDDARADKRDQVLNKIFCRKFDKKCIERVMWDCQKVYAPKQDDVKVGLHGVKPNIIMKRIQSFCDPDIHKASDVYNDLQWRYRYVGIHHNNYGFGMKEIVAIGSKVFRVWCIRRGITQLQLEYREFEDILNLEKRGPDKMLITNIVRNEYNMYRR